MLTHSGLTLSKNPSGLRGGPGPSASQASLDFFLDIRKILWVGGSLLITGKASYSLAASTCISHQLWGRVQPGLMTGTHSVDTVTGSSPICLT